MRAAAALDQLAGSVRPGRRHDLWRRVPLPLKVLLIAVLGIEALYVIGANAFLSFGGVAKALAGQDDVDATFRRAWTFWPGEVHARDLRVTFQDHNAQFSLDLPRAKLCLRLLELPRRVFHATCVEGEGAVFRLRHRVHPEKADHPSVQAVPAIPEFETPAVFEARVPKPPLTDEEYNLWTVHLEHVDVDLRELWVQQFRYLGEASARGAFRLRPVRSLWIGPASLELEGGRLLAGNVPVAESLSGHVDCSADFFDVRAVLGRDVLGEISTNVRLRGRQVRLDAANLFVDPGARLRVSSGEGTLEVAVSIVRGVIEPVSQIVVENEHVRLDRAPFAVRLEQAKLELTGGPDERGEARLTTAAASLEHGSRPGPGALAGPLSVELESSSLDTTEDWSMLHGQLEAPDLRIPDLAWLSGLVGDVRPRRGSARASLSARTAPESLRLDVGGEVRQPEVELESCALAGFSQGTFQGEFERNAERRELSFGIQIGKLELRSGKSSAQGFQAGIERLALNGDWSGAGSVSQGSLRVAAVAARGRVGKTPLAADLQADVDVTALDLQQGEARGSGTLSIRNGALSAASTEIKGWWADIALKSALISLRPELDAGGTFTARLRDGQPVLSILAAEDELPNWVAKALPENKLEVSGLFRRRCQLTELLLKKGRGPLLEARGRVLSTPAETRTAFLLSLQGGPLAVGLSSGPGSDGVTPLAGDDWLREHQEKIAARASELRRQPCAKPKPDCGP